MLTLEQIAEIRASLDKVTLPQWRTRREIDEDGAIYSYSVQLDPSPEDVKALRTGVLALCDALEEVMRKMEEVVP